MKDWKWQPKCVMSAASAMISHQFGQITTV